ncbi:MAG: pyridoxal 5'-phosphate synthase glutaminase subunit PdxT [Acidimicrobiales bacterium]
MTIGVLALQGDVREHAAAFADLGEAVREIRRPDDLAGLDGLVMPGGESTTLSLLLGSCGLDGPLADALGSGLPVFGTCAGMILLATTVLDGRPDQISFGAIELTIRRNGYGRQVASFEGRVEVAGLGAEPLPAVFIRAPVVEAIGPGVEVLATLPGEGDDPERPVVCRQGAVLVASFHPELTPDRRLHRLFVEMTKEERR